MKINTSFDGLNYPAGSNPVFKRLDYGFDLQLTLTNDVGVPVDLTSYSSITFQIKSLSSALPKFTGTCTVVTAASGIFKYTISSTDFDAVGIYEVEYTFDTGTSKRIVSNGLLTIVENI